MIPFCQVSKLRISPKQKLERIKQPLNPHMCVIIHCPRQSSIITVRIRQNIIKIDPIALTDVIDKVRHVNCHWLGLVVSGIVQIHHSEKFMHQKCVFKSHISAHFVRLDHIAPAVFDKSVFQSLMENIFADEEKVEPPFDPMFGHACGVWVVHVHWDVFLVDQVYDLGLWVWF